MSPDGQVRVGKPAIRSNLYTVILALALCAAAATVAFVLYKCYFDYGTLFKIP